jgi:hypothetical protein
MSAAADFLNYLYRPYRDIRGLTCELRAFHPIETGHAVERHWFALDHLDAAAERAVQMAPEADVYMGVLPRVGRGGHSKDVSHAAWLYCDLDAGNDRGAVGDMIRAFADRYAPPGMVVTTTSGGAHLYWPLELVHLSTDVKRQAYQDLLRRVVRAMGGTKPGPAADPAACDLARILRVPGTLYHKVDPPTPVRFGVIQSPRRPASWWYGILPALPIITPSRAAAIDMDRIPIADDAELVRRMFASRHGEAIRALWEGEVAKYGNDDSAADIALVSHLLWWACGDEKRAERLMGMSALGQRDKWRERADYRARTIERAASR